MNALKPLIASVVLSVCCASAHADLVIEQVGAVQFGNSWTLPFTVANPGLYDLFVIEVVGDTFESPPVAPAIVTAPGTWTGSWISSTQVRAEGPAFSGLVGLSLTFDSADPPNTFGDIEIHFSAFEPGNEHASISGGMLWNGASFSFAAAPLTTQTRSALASAPAPGAVFLGLIGFGLVGVARKRLR